MILFTPTITFKLTSIITPNILTTLKQINNTITTINNNNPYTLTIILKLIIPITNITPLNSIILTNLLKLTNIPITIKTLTYTNNSFINLILFQKLNINKPSKTFTIYIKPLTQINLITQYPIQLYNTNTLIKIINTYIITFNKLIINIKNITTPITNTIILFNFNNTITSIITITTIIIINIILTYIIKTLINKFNLININFKIPNKKNHIKKNI